MMADLEIKLKEKIGDNNLLEKSLQKVKPLVGEDGMEAYLSLVDLFTPFDLSLSKWLLGNGAETLSRMGSEQTRRKALGVILGMGRSKWSVSAVALKNIPVVPDTDSGFIVQWLRHGSDLAFIDQDAALQYFEAGPSVLEMLGAERFGLWASLGMEIAEKSWKAAKEYFRSSPKVIKKIAPSDLEPWARLGILLIEKSPYIKAEYDAHSLLATGAHAGKGKRLELAVQYFKSAPQVLGRLSIHDLREWVLKGLKTAGDQEDRGNAYFSLQTGRSRTAVEGLVKGLELRDIYTVLRSYAEALTGIKVLLRSSSLFYKDLPGLSRFFTVTDGTRIFLPSNISAFEEQELNFKAYKMALTHEIAHIQFGTFNIGVSGLKRLSEFRKPALAFKVFEFLEDERVDYLMGSQYPGLEKDRTTIVKKHLEDRDSLEEGRSLPEALRLSSHQEYGPTGHAEGELTGMLHDALIKVKTPGASVYDVLDLTVQVCSELERTKDEGTWHLISTAERIFYRGTLDFELVERAHSGMSSLILDMTERLQDKKTGVDYSLVEEAINRIEESEVLESDELIWQIDDDERRNELFEQVQQVIADMEAEQHIRRTVYYDEWDLKLDDYKKDWCKVREMDIPETSTAFYNNTVRENYGLVSLLRRYFGLLRPDRIQRFFHEERGDEVDYNALIESVIERHAGIMPSDRVYIRREKNLRDVSVAFLVDMSYSTGDMLPFGKRIIDVEREGLVLMAEALESIGDQWALYGFSTNRREKVDFYIVRDFGMPFRDDVKMRFENIRPMAQTRLGAVIRHAVRLLARQTSRIRLLILLSDGRPYDIDYGDADYAVEDTRRALWDARRRGINYFCITVDKKSRDYVPYMYGESNYTLIDNIEALPVMMPLIYKRLTT